MNGFCAGTVEEMAEQILWLMAHEKKAVRNQPSGTPDGNRYIQY
jgi:hypothetical protein